MNLPETWGRPSVTSLSVFERKKREEEGGKVGQRMNGRERGREAGYVREREGEMEVGYVRE